MAPLLEYYNATHQFNNLLTVLLKYLNLFSMAFFKNLSIYRVFVHIMLEK